jgi:hypothetical protein
LRGEILGYNNCKKCGAKLKHLTQHHQFKNENGVWYNRRYYECPNHGLITAIDYPTPERRLGRNKRHKK